VKSANPTRIPACRRQGTSPLSSYPPTNRIPPEGPPQFCILHFDLCIFRYKCRESSTNRPFSCKTNPICTNPEYSLTSVLTKTYAKNAEFTPPKANPNKPKQSQSDPHFSPVMAPQSQNKPKRTQNKPNSPKTQKSAQLLFFQSLTTKIANSPQPERTQSNPISNTAPRPACQSE